VRLETTRNQSVDVEFEFAREKKTRLTSTRRETTMREVMIPTTPWICIERVNSEQEKAEKELTA